MLSLSLQTVTTLISGMTAAVQGACSLTVNKVALAILNANASVAAWLQWLLVLLMNRQRLASSIGADVDSFVADFDFFRLPNQYSYGVVTLARYTDTASATVLVGTTVMTGDASTSFAIVADTTNGLYNAALTNPAGVVVGGFVIPALTASANLKAQAVVPAAAGNVVIGAISLLGSAIVGVDTVTNAAAFVGGADPEPDASVKARFVNYIGGLYAATPRAIQNAVTSVQQGIAYYIGTNVSTADTYQPGNFVVVVDDGTGFPPALLITNVALAVNAVRGVTDTFSVQAPAVTEVAVAFTLTVVPGAVKTLVAPLVAAAVTAYVNALPIGATLPIAIIPWVAFNASGSVANCTLVTLNSGTADIAVAPFGVIKTASVAVN